MKNRAVLIGCLLIIGSFQVLPSETNHALQATPGLTQSSGCWTVTVDEVRQQNQVSRIGRGIVNDLA